MPGPPAVQKKMFGYPAGFVNGTLFMGLFQDELMLRLPESYRQKLLESGKAQPFEPMPGRPMREYVAIPDALKCNRKELAVWIAHAFEHGISLKPKSSLANARKPSAKRKAKSRSNSLKAKRS